MPPVQILEREFPFRIGRFRIPADIEIGRNRIGTDIGNDRNRIYSDIGEFFADFGSFSTELLQSLPGCDESDQ